MHLEHLVPGGFGRLGKGLVQQDAGVVDQDIGAAEMLDGVVEHRLPAGHGRDIGAVGNRAAALRLDRADHLLRHRCVAAGAVAGPPRSLTTTAAPSRANSLAYASPRPPPAPVISAT